VTQQFQAACASGELLPLTSPRLEEEEEEEEGLYLQIEEGGEEEEEERSGTAFPIPLLAAAASPEELARATHRAASHPLSRLVNKPLPSPPPPFFQFQIKPLLLQQLLLLLFLLFLLLVQDPCRRQRVELDDSQAISLHF